MLSYLQLMVHLDCQVAAIYEQQACSIDLTGRFQPAAGCLLQIAI